MVARLCSLHHTEFLKYCCMICDNVGDTEDLLQETFVGVLSYQDFLEDLGDRERKAWLYKVVRNLFFGACRRYALEQNKMPRPEDVVEGGSSDVETIMLPSLLPPDAAELFQRRYFKGYSSRELAELYGPSPSGVRAALSRTRKELRESLKTQEEETLMKKSQVVDAAYCDARRVTEESFGGYGNISISAAILVTGESARALLSRYYVSLNVTNSLNLPGNEKLEVQFVSGRGELNAETDGTGKVLMVDGRLTL